MVDNIHSYYFVKRFTSFLDRNVRSFYKSFQKDSIIASKCGEKILVNSVPKAGTHLIEEALMLLPGIRFSGMRTILDWEECTPHTIKKISRIKRGRFSNAHLPAHDNLLECIGKSNIKVLVMIRDPRDVVVSNCKYVTYMDTMHPCHNFMKSLHSEDERITAVINGVPNLIASVATLWDNFYPWITHDDCLVIRYEDIIGPLGGGTKEKQFNAMKKIAKYLSVSLTDQHLTFLLPKIFNPKSPTFRKGSISSWKLHFNKYHYGLFKECCGDMLVKLDYEKNNDWR